jgi:hypothetical protein
MHGHGNRDAAVEIGIVDPGLRVFEGYGLQTLRSQDQPQSTIGD